MREDFNRLEKRFDDKYGVGEGKIGLPNSCCSICLDSFHDHQERAMTWCEHIYHKTCIATWIKQHHSCPVCRHPTKDFFKYRAPVPVRIKTLLEHLLFRW